MKKTKKTNFDIYLERQLEDPDFAEGFRKAGEAWDVAIRIATLREKAGLSQKALALRAGTTQQQISRLESPGYGGHSLSLLRRIARALHTEVRVIFEPAGAAKSSARPRGRAAPMPARVRAKGNA